MRAALFVAFLIVLIIPQPALAQTEVVPTRQAVDPGQVTISAPVGGQVLQGLVIVQGSSTVTGYLSSSVAFSYRDDLTDTWFLITESETPVSNGALATWDTTTISDGNYDLRLVVRLTDGNQAVTYVEGLRVRNYSPIESDTPTPPAPTTSLLTPTPGETVIPGEVDNLRATHTVTPVPPTVTPLPPNPAEISRTTILTTLGKGGLTALVLFALLGAYFTGRSFKRRPTRSRRL